MKHYHKNPRQITKKQFADLQDSLRRLGDLGGIVHDLTTDEIVGGNQRMDVFDLKNCQIEITERLDEPDEQGTAARGWVVWQGKKYSYRAVMWDDKTREEANIRANKAGGDWDFDILANNFEIPDLLEWGFDEKELLGVFKDEPKGEDPGARVDKAEELRERWGVESGQLWQLGEHRLICGDCTDNAVVDRVMVGEKEKYLFTDPPYGIDYDPRFLAKIAERHNKKLSSTNKVINDDGSLDLSFLFEFENRMIWGFPYIYDPEATGWIVWDKQPGVDSRGIVTPIEMASTTMRKGFDMVRCMWGGFYRAAGEDKQPHQTQKPLGVYQPFVEGWTKEGEIIYDPFSGSAPVLMVCERLSRKCRAVEISPAYVAVALQRWSDMTGKQPVLLSSSEDLPGGGQ